MAILTAGVTGVDFDDLIVSDVLLGTVTSATGAHLTLRDGAWQDDFTGQFTYANGEIAGGTLTGWKQSLSGQMVFDLTGVSAPVTQFITWAATDNNEAAKTTLLSGADSILGSEAVDRMHGYAGNDTISGGGADDFLRGEDGNDLIHGGVGFDDTHGNKGEDTIYGGLGPDWVVGGQDNDLLFGDDGADIVYGNLGVDLLYGGGGGDWVRGGQGDDSLSGDAGDDWMSGDRGSDTVSGGAGADIFHVIVDAGIDRVIDFNRAEGDRVQVESGAWTTAQVAGDVVITLSGGGQMILVGVQLVSLSGDWISTG
jgi:serralysin